MLIAHPKGGEMEEVVVDMVEMVEVGGSFHQFTNCSSCKMVTLALIVNLDYVLPTTRGGGMEELGEMAMEEEWDVAMVEVSTMATHHHMAKVVYWF